MDDFKVLPAGVEDLQHVLVFDHQLEDRGQIDVRLRVDRRRFLAARDLQQAQDRPVGVLAHELGVDGDERLLREPVDQLCEFVGVGDERVNSHESDWQ